MDASRRVELYAGPVKLDKHRVQVTPLRYYCGHDVRWYHGSINGDGMPIDFPVLKGTEIDLCEHWRRCTVICDGLLYELAVLTM